MLAVTPADVQRVAAKYLARNKAVVVWSVPEEDEKKGDAEPRGVASRRGRAPSGRGQRDAPNGGAEPRRLAPLDLADAKRVVLPNGLTLLMLPEPPAADRRGRRPTSRDVRLREPADKAGVAALVGEMLEEGTAEPHRDGDRHPDRGHRRQPRPCRRPAGRVKVLTPDTDLGLGLLFDCLTDPTFPDDALERKRDQLLSVIADVETQPQNRAQAAVPEPGVRRPPVRPAGHRASGRSWRS